MFVNSVHLFYFTKGYKTPQRSFCDLSLDPMTMSLLSRHVNSSNHPTGNQDYFQNLTHWPPSLRSLNSLGLLEKSLQLPVWQHINGFASWTTASAPGLHPCTESFRTPKVPAQTMQLNKGSNQRTNGQNDVVCKQLPKRPIVPTNPRDWESKKHIIRELYMNQNKILNEVIDIMISKHSFKATYVPFSCLGPSSLKIVSDNIEKGEDVQGPVCQMEVDKVQQARKTWSHEANQIGGGKEKGPYSSKLSNWPRVARRSRRRTAVDVLGSAKSSDPVS